MVRMLVPCSTNAAVRTCPFWGWLVPSGAGLSPLGLASGMSQPRPSSRQWSFHESTNEVRKLLTQWPCLLRCDPHVCPQAGSDESYTAFPEVSQGYDVIAWKG